MTRIRRSRWGLGLVMAGLLVQVAASFFWRPGTFILSAAVGFPMVLVGGVLTWMALRGKDGGGK